MLFSRVKTSCFRAKAHLVFHWCLYDNSSLDGDLLAYDCFLFRGGDARPLSQCLQQQGDSLTYLKIQNSLVISKNPRLRTCTFPNWPKQVLTEMVICTDLGCLSS